MSKKVVALHGGPVAACAEPNPEVVQQLRDLLGAAERGDVQGVAVVATKANETVTTLLCTNGNHFAMSHAIGALWFRFQQRMADDANNDSFSGDPDGP